MNTSTKTRDLTPEAAPKRMATSTKWIIGILGASALLALLTALGVISLFTLNREVTGNPEPVVEAPIADGEWFGFVIVNDDGAGEITLGLDLAEMLTGQEAHDAAVEAGIITADEDLPNDYFIRNDETTVEVMNLSDDAEISVISGDDVSQHMVISAEELSALYDGTYDGPAVYGIAAGQPIVMDVTVSGGEITKVTAFYLP